MFVFGTKARDKGLFKGCSVYFNAAIEKKKQQEVGFLFALVGVIRSPHTFLGKLRKLLRDKGGTTMYDFKKKTTTHVVTEHGDLDFSEHRAALKRGIHVVSVRLRCD